MYGTANKIVNLSHQPSYFDAPRARNAHNNSPRRAEQCPRDSGTAAPRAQNYFLHAARNGRTLAPKNRKNMIVHKSENNLEEVYIVSTEKTARVEYAKGGGCANHGGVGGVLPRGPSLGRPERLEGGENLETGTSRDGHVVSRDGHVVSRDGHVVDTWCLGMDV